MGYRANYVIREDGDYELYYSERGALTVPRDVFWGPDIAEAFIRRNRSVEPDQWLDDIAGEGGVTLDKTEQTMVLFGGEVLCLEPLRSVFLELMRGLWSRWGWSVEWAHWGIPDLAEQVGVDPASVASDPPDEMVPSVEDLGHIYRDRERFSCLVTVVEEGEVRDLVSGYDVDDILAAGAEILEGLEQLPTLEQVVDEYEPPEYADPGASMLGREFRSNLIVDFDRRRIVYFGYVTYGELKAIEAIWESSGWELEYRREQTGRMAEHFRVTGREVPEELTPEDDADGRTRDDLLEEVARELFADRSVDPSDDLGSLTAEPSAPREQGPVAPQSREAPVDGRPDEETCKERFGWALAAVAEEDI